MRDMVRGLADRLSMRPVSVLRYLRPRELAALAFEAGYPQFIRAQAEVAEGKRESVEEAIERGLAHAELARDYAEIVATSVGAVPGVEMASGEGALG
jgi:hypothetical protein